MRSAASVEFVHAGRGEPVNLEAGGVEFALAVGAGGGPGGSGVAVVRLAGVGGVGLGGHGAVSVPLDRGHEAVRRVPHGGEH